MSTGHGLSLNLSVCMTHIAASRKPRSQLGCVIVETLDCTAVEHKETGIRRISPVLSPLRIDNLCSRHRERNQYVLLTEIISKYFDHQDNVVRLC